MIVERQLDGATRVWASTTLDKLGLDEKFLEDTIAAAPDLLGLESRRTGMYGPYKAFTQIDLRTPTKRNIHADVILFAMSGHVILVEVKLFANSELRDRSVISQIIDYASSIQALDEAELCRVFGAGYSQKWADVVQSWFPDEQDADDLAFTLQQRMRTGEINLVIACDRIPAGVYDVVRGISTQAAVGFELDLVEITPCHLSEIKNGPIFFLPRIRWGTEIVARTVVSIKYEAGSPRPEVSVVTTNAEAIAENIREIKIPSGREYSEEEVREDFSKLGNATALELLEFCAANSTNGQFVAPGIKQKASFGFYLPFVDAAGRQRSFMAFTIGNTPDPKLYWYFQRIREGGRCFPEFESRVKAIFGSDIDPSRKEAYQSFQSIDNHMAEFKALMIWLRDHN
jgi:hypothetical protein